MPQKTGLNEETEKETVNESDVTVETPETEKSVKSDKKSTKKAESKKAKNEAVKLQAELDKALKELEQTKDLLMRTAAEYDNFKRRTEKEKSDLTDFVKAATVKNLLPVADNISRASQSDPQSADYVKGLEMIIKQLSDSLDKIGLKEIEAEGKEFDPNLHEAVMHIEDEEAGENTVVQVLQAGYKLGNTVLRPAMVKVAN